MARFRVYGVDDETGFDTDLVVQADNEANAKVKAQRQGVTVTNVESLDAQPVMQRADPPGPTQQPPREERHAHMHHHAPPHTTTVNVNQPPTNGLGTAGFITAIVSWFTCGFLAPIAFLMSFIAAFKRPRGMAIGGLCVSGLAVIPMALFRGGIVAVPFVGAARETARQMQRETEARQVIERHHLEHQEVPSDQAGQRLLDDEFPDRNPAPRYERSSDDLATVTWPGGDGRFGTADDSEQRISP